jgi:hypothetical protein
MLVYINEIIINLEGIYKTQNGQAQVPNPRPPCYGARRIASYMTASFRRQTTDMTSFIYYEYTDIIPLMVVRKMKEMWILTNKA